MGCFNVACSVSNISLGHGTRVVFIPLTKSGTAKYNGLSNQSMLTYSNCFYNPLSFPIRGEYNDYGSMENIDDNANSKALEEFFGMNIEVLVDSITRNQYEGLYDGHYAASCLVKNLKDINSRDPLNEKFLKKMGFTDNKDGTFSFDKYPYDIEITNKIKGTYAIYNKGTKDVVKSKHRHRYNERVSLLEEFADITGYYIGIEKDKQKGIRILRDLAGMFIHEEIYEELCNHSSRADKAPGEQDLIDLGFVYDPDRVGQYKEDKFFYHPEVEDDQAYVCAARYGSGSTFDKETKDKNYGDWLRSCYELAEQYIEKHGVTLDLTSFENELSTSTQFNDLRNKVLKSNMANMAHKLTKSKDKVSLMMNDVFSGFSRPEELRAFEDWEYFKDIYRNSITDGSIKEEYCKWLIASSAMYSANVFFFPAMNGEQHGNHQQSKIILEKALEIVNAKIKYYEEEC